MRVLELVLIEDEGSRFDGLLTIVPVAGQGLYEPRFRALRHCSPWLIRPTTRVRMRVQNRLRLPLFAVTCLAFAPRPAVFLR